MTSRTTRNSSKAAQSTDNNATDSASGAAPLQKKKDDRILQTQADHLLQIAKNDKVLAQKGFKKDFTAAVWGPHAKVLNDLGKEQGKEKTPEEWSDCWDKFVVRALKCKLKYETKEMSLTDIPETSLKILEYIDKNLKIRQEDLESLDPNSTLAKGMLHQSTSEFNMQTFCNTFEKHITTEIKELKVQLQNQNTENLQKISLIEAEINTFILNFQGHRIQEQEGRDKNETQKDSETEEESIFFDSALNGKLGTE